MTAQEALRRWPRLVAHMICESLGYFTPLSAANALVHYKADESYACEWYSHMSSCRGKDFFDHEELLKVGRDVIQCAFEHRHGHSGYMSEFERALALVKAELKKEGATHAMFASWF